MTITSCASAHEVDAEVCVLVEERYLTQAQPAGVVQALESRGVRVRTVVAEAVSVDLAGSWTRGSSVVLARDFRADDRLFASGERADHVHLPPHVEDLRCFGRDGAGLGAAVGRRDAAVA